MAECSQEFQEQKDEVLALQSMYEDTGEITVLQALEEKAADCTELSDRAYILQIDVEPEVCKAGVALQVWVPEDHDVTGTERVTGQVPSPTKPTFQRSESGHRWHTTCHLSYLTPLCLQLNLPKTYPSAGPPSFSLSCLWLDASQLSALCQQLDELWTQMEGMPIIFTWIDWLQNQTLSFLGLERDVMLMPYKEQNEESKPCDPRALPEGGNLNDDLLHMLRYAHKKDYDLFTKMNQTCGVCFDEKAGSEFFRMGDCCHHFCRECTAAYIEMHVKDGTVQMISCPDRECKSGIVPWVVQTVLGEEEYARWERLQLQRALDTMGDIEWCPRCNNVVVKDEQEKLNLAHCLTCFYSFCTECREAWHQGFRCSADLVEEKSSDADLVEEKLDGNRATRRQRHNQNMLSRLEIKSHTKRCPKCKVPIYKFDGCNKVACSQCYQYMCWICGLGIKDYDHFKATKCPLFLDVDDNPPGFYRPQRPEAEGAQRVRHALHDLEAAQRIILCPRCRQRNLKQGHNNHIKCWSCKINLCFMCRVQISGPVLAHFNPPSVCRQHTA